VAIAKQRHRRQQPQLPLQAKVWSWFLGATVGHGYRLWFAGAWLLVLTWSGACSPSSSSRKVRGRSTT
jgi:hypothetical protein